MKPILTFFTLLTFLTLSLVLNSCRNSGKPQPDLVTLDIIPALTNYKEFRLSQLVDSIEYVKLETRPECLISNASRVIGKKYILLLNHQPRQVLLFDRSGKFIRLIGKIGKGPGEYSDPENIDLSPDEERIMISDERKRMFMEYSVNGELILTREAPFERSAGPYYIDQQHIVFMQSPWSDTTHYPRLVAMNLETGQLKPLHYFNFRKNPEQNTDYCFQNDFFRTDDGILFKDALCDTVYQVVADLSLKPVYVMRSFPRKALYYCLTEQEGSGLGSVSPDCFTPQFIFLIGDEKQRFHLVYNSATKETFRLPKLKECKIESGYPYGIINDLDGTDPVWFWANTNVRNSKVCNLLQIVDLKEKIKTDCFIKAGLKSNRYRDQLKKMVEESSENDNPIIRIMHLR